MALRELRLKKSYDSDIDDILSDFYVPALSQSVLYRRLTGFFSSTSFAVAARGVSKLISNGGRMELVTGARFRKTDLKAIREAYQNPESVIERMMLDELDALENKFVEDHVRALGWMIANNKLEIKVVIVLGNDGQLLDERNVEKLGIFHQKVGILEDNEGNQISFSGSENESAAGWLGNIEEFKVFRSWVDIEKEYLQTDLDKFEKFWKDKSRRARVIDIPKAVEEKLIEIAPDDFESLDLDKWLIKIHKKRRSPYPFQLEAISSWEAADYKGILAMATGSGKTYTAIKALERCEKLKLSLIVVPSIDLITQWETEIRFEYKRQCVVRRVSSKERDWRRKTERLIEALKLDLISEKAFVITTLQTASRNIFLEVIQKFPKENLAIVVDEVHHAGAPVSRNVFQINSRFRLGLSATPEREWDEEGNQVIFNYFGPVVYEYDITSAIKDGYLSEYRYHIHVVSLNQEERNAFTETSQSIAVTTSQIHSEFPSTRQMSVPRMLQYLDSVNSDLSNKLRALYLRRVRIIKKAQNKATAFRNIIKKHQLKRCLVYCNDLQHIDENIRIIHEEGYIPIEFSSRIEPKVRAQILSSFEKNLDQNTFLVAVKCLDEGVDLPACDSAVLISCSRSTREFVQRRGRVLRRHSTKVFSIIHDIVVLPFISDDDAYPITLSEFNFVKEELRRIKLFSENALNKREFNIGSMLYFYRKYLLF